MKLCVGMVKRNANHTQKECAQSAKKFYKEDKMASDFDGPIGGLETEIRLLENQIKLQREKKSPDADKIERLKSMLEDFKRQKKFYENHRNLGM